MKEIGHLFFEMAIWVTMVIAALKGYTELTMMQCTMLLYYTLRHIADEQSE